MTSFVGTQEANASPALNAATALVRRPVVGAYRTPAKVFHWLTVGLVAIMVSSGVLAKQLGEGATADFLFSLHKLTGVVTLALVLIRIGYRVFRSLPESRQRPASRAALHWALYGTIVLVPLLGWAGISDFGAREVFGSFSLPPIWPQGAGYDELLLQWHAYFAFGLLALVAVHIGVALQDYMGEERALRSED
ncbi:MAG TPA: cytochrome b/b6 domain-containing protein [Xanthobacteraceae bacterium]|nr:cytochrome b/b6 domain-containing protein [Xanthobacteraceae bacterium]